MIQEFLHLELMGYRVFDKATIKPPFRILAKMPDEACFYFLIRGKALVNTPYAEIEMQSNDGLVMQCGTYLNRYVQEEGIEYCEAIAVHLYPELLKAIYDEDLPQFLAHLKDIKPLPYKKYEAGELMKYYVSGLQFYFENPEMVSEELLKLKIKELMILLAKTDKLDQIKMLFARLFTPQEYDFREIIEENYDKEVSLQELAELCRMSLSSFKRKFNAVFNTSPGKYIRSKKIEKASNLLKATRLSVTEVCYECGFSDLAHFSKLFSKEKGTSPSKYRLDFLD